MTEAVPGLLVPTSLREKVEKADTVLDGIMGRVTTPNEIKYLKTLIYARPGMGKTTFCGRAPNPFIYDIDETAVTLQQDPSTAEVPTLTYKSEYQLEQTIQRMIDGSLEERVLKEKGKAIDTYSFDSFTVFQVKSLKTQIRAQLGGINDKEVTSYLTKYLSSDFNWNANTQYLEDIITQISKVEKDVIITCHLKREKDQTSSVDQWLLRPDLTNKVYTALSRWANIIGYMEYDPGGDKRTLRIKPTRLIDAKTHIGGPDVISNPTYQKLLEIKKGTYK